MGPWVVFGGRWGGGSGLHLQRGCTGVIGALCSRRQQPKQGLSHGDGQRPDIPWTSR